MILYIQNCRLIIYLFCKEKPSKACRYITKVEFLAIHTHLKGLVSSILKLIKVILFI